MGRFVHTCTSLTVANHSGPQPGRRPPQPGIGRPLVPHLRRQLVLSRYLAHQASLVDRARQRLLAETVLAHPHGHQRGRGMIVVRRAHGDRIDARLHLLEHLAKIVESFRLLEGTLRALLERAVVDITDGHDVAVIGRVGRVAIPFASHTDAGKAYAFVR